MALLRLVWKLIGGEVHTWRLAVTPRTIAWLETRDQQTTDRRESPRWPWPVEW